MGRKTLVFMLFFFLLGPIIIFPALYVRGISLEPAKLYISMPEGYPKRDIKYNIGITNTHSYDIEASVRVISPWYLKDKDYVMIPDLSWVEVSPETIYIPAGSSAECGLTIDIPDEEKPLHYNKSWEVWILVSPRQIGEDIGGQIGIGIQMQLVARVFINTPPEEMKVKVPQNIFILLGGFVGFIALVFIYFFVRKKKSIEARRAAVFYVKKRRGNTLKGYNKKN